MNNKVVIILIIFLFLSCGKNKEEIKITRFDEHEKELKSQSGAQTDFDKIISSTDAKNYLNIETSVSGYVADVVIREKVAYLNFDEKFPKNSFSAVIFKDYFPLFGDLNKYKNKNVEVKGKITIYSGKPQIITTSPEQIKLVE